MINLDYIRQAMTVDYNDVSFDYHGKRAWITYENVWRVYFGPDELVGEFHDVDKFIDAKVFDGRSLRDLVGKVDIMFA